MMIEKIPYLPEVTQPENDTADPKTLRVFVSAWLGKC